MKKSSINAFSFNILHRFAQQSNTNPATRLEETQANTNSKEIQETHKLCENMISIINNI